MDTSHKDDGRPLEPQEVIASDPGRAVVLHPQLEAPGAERRSGEACLEEAQGLAEAIGLKIAHGEVIRVKRQKPATLIGGGAVERLSGVIAAEGAGLVVVDHALTPVQQRNLEKAWKAKVIDRTGLILEIFGERARTKEGQLQVELAALTYQRSRLVRSWTHLERQRGGLGFIGGPGESQLEIDRRLITERITRIKRELEQVVRTRQLHRQARKRVPFPVVALVGYTNAGKSTLFNRLTEAEVVAQDQLFATLDPTMRRVRLPSGNEIILSDTVGFVSNLPTQLVAAFRATLEEVTGADIVVHVRDMAHPDSESQARDVLEVLRELGLEETVDAGMIEAQNKIDLLDEQDRRLLLQQSERDPQAVPVSALTGEGCGELLEVIDRKLTEDQAVSELDVPLDDGAALAWLYRKGKVVEREDDEAYAHLRVRLSSTDLARFARQFPVAAEASFEPLGHPEGA